VSHPSVGGVGPDVGMNGPSSPREGDIMRNMFCVRAIGLAVVWLVLGAGESGAQIFTGAGGPVAVSGPSYVVEPWAASPTVAAWPTQPAFTYSYATAFPNPARQYVPYGSGDIFPYDGQAYGHPYERWSWTHLAGYNELLSRYYYPPVR
jgi:hypothetical protein